MGEVNSQPGSYHTGLHKHAGSAISMSTIISATDSIATLSFDVLSSSTLLYISKPIKLGLLLVCISLIEWVKFEILSFCVLSLSSPSGTATHNEFHF